MRIFRLALTGVALFGAVTATAAREDGQAQSATIAPTGILAGQAMDAVTGAPVANTLIGLSQRAGPGPNTTPTAPNTSLVTVMADSRGRFVVRDVPKGSFLLLATAPGYIVSNYGQARPAGPTRTIDLTGEERIVDLKIRLWRHGVISGLVVDEAGEPVVGVVVRVLRRAPNGAGGQPRYMPGTQTTTDDRGRYRLTALSPGQFLVTVPQTQATVPAAVVGAYLQAGVSRAGSAAGGQLLDLMSSASAVPSAGGGVRVDDLLLQSSAGGRLMTPPPQGAAGFLVYPTAVATGDGNDREIVVGAGDERTGIDFTLRPERARKVTGVVTADGAPVGRVSVRLIRNDGRTALNQNGYEAATTVTAENGTFTLLGVTSGEYTLKVLRTPRLTLPPALAANPAIVEAYAPETSAPAPAAGAAGTSMIGAEMPVRITDVDRTGLVVELRAGAAVSGKVVFTGTPPTAQQMQKFGALLASEEGALPGAGLQIARVDSTGAFVAKAPAPGRYSVTVLGPPAAGWRFAGMHRNGSPVAGPLDLGGPDIGDLTITFTDEVGDIAGILTRAGATPVTTAGIVVFPTERGAWIQDPLNARQPRIEQSQRGGSFAVGGLLPGDYFVAAIEDADVPDVADAVFLEAVSRVATRVRVTPRARQDIALTIRSLK